MSSFQVRNADSSWRDVRKQLRKDQRWDLADSIDREEKEKLFEEHMDELSKKSKEMFHKLLEETAAVSHTTPQAPITFVVKVGCHKQTIEYQCVPLEGCHKATASF